MTMASLFQLERLRNRVVQTAFSTPGTQMPEKEMSDDELIEELHKLLGDRRELVSRIKELEAEVKDAMAGTERIKDEGERLREALQGSLVSEKLRIRTSLHFFTKVV